MSEEAADVKAVLSQYGRDPYLEWVAKEGLNVVEDYGIDLFSVETKMWPRLGVKGAAAHLKGRGDFSAMFVYDIGPGGSTSPQRHLYEEVIYVLEGTGSTQVEFQDGTKRSFEWGPRGMFAIPVNARHRHFNGSGQKRALLASTHDFPLVMNTFHNEKFIFDVDFDFSDRAGKSEYYTGEGDLIIARQGNHMWETNFVPDLEAIELKSWGDRGAGGSNIMFVLADGLMHAHISEMPVGTYKKGHRHPPGFHVMCVVGEGYSLLWFEGDKDYLRIDWKHGVVFPPADQQFHQHFNTSSRPARYLATGVGGLRYPLMAVMRKTLMGATLNDKAAVSTSIREGGFQVEYTDQDPQIHRTWLEAMRKSGTTPKMDRFFTPEGDARPVPLPAPPAAAE